MSLVAAGPGRSALSASGRERDGGTMTETERIKKLEDQMNALEKQQMDLANELAQARLDQWKGRLEDLEVQAHLGAMDTNDRVAALTQKARDRWDDARKQVSGASATAADVWETVRGGVENAIGDLRKALFDAKTQASK